MKKYIVPALLCGTALAAAAADPADAATMQCQPYGVYNGAPYPGQGPYTADNDGIVTGVAENDILAMLGSGCKQIGTGGYTLIGRIVAANFNTTADQLATLFIGATQFYIPGEMVVKNCSVSLATATGAVYDTAGKTGTKLFSETSSGYTACTTVAGTTQPFAATTPGSKKVEAATSPPILSLTATNSTTSTGNVYFYGYVLGQ